MKSLHATVRALYWLALALVPFAPSYFTTVALERSGCSYGSSCFEHAIPVVSEMGVVFGILALLLWPLCVWQLGGRWVWRRVNAKSAA